MKRSAFFLVLTVASCIGSGVSQFERIEPRHPEPVDRETGRPFTTQERAQFREAECEFRGCGQKTQKTHSPRSTIFWGNLDNHNNANQVVHLDDPAPKGNVRIQGLEKYQPKPVDVLGLESRRWGLQLPDPKAADHSTLKETDRSKWTGSIIDVWSSPAGRDIIERGAADHELQTFNKTYPHILCLRIELDPTNLSHRYRAYDGSTTLFSGNDVGDLIHRLSGKLDAEKSSIVIGLAGFHPQESMSFATELNVQQELFYPSHEWLPLAGAQPDLQQLYNATGLAFEGMILTKVNRPTANRDKWHARIRFTDGVRKFWVWMHSNSDGFMELVSRFANNLFSPNTSQRSPSAAVAWTRFQLLGSHPELSEGQFDIEIREELRSIHLGELGVVVPREG